MTTTANDTETLQRLHRDILALPYWKSPWRSSRQDPIALRLERIKRGDVINRLEHALQQQSFQMLEVAREQSDYFTKIYQKEVTNLANFAQYEQSWVIALFIASLFVTWIIGYLFLGRHVFGRLRVVSHHLRRNHVMGTVLQVPVAGTDEIAEMARAVEGLMQDREQLLQARATLQTSENWLASIIQNAADGFVIVQDGLIRQLNPAAKSLLDWQPGEVPRLMLGDMQASEYLMLPQTEKAMHYTTMAYRSDDKEIPVDISCNEVTLLSKPVTILIIRDATIRLETEQQLIAAKDLAEATRNAHAAFLANMSHEFRTPLNAIIGYAQILKRDEIVFKRESRALNTIEQSGEHILMLVNDILDLAQVEAGRIELCSAPIELNKFLQVISDIIMVKVEEKSLLFHCIADSDLPKTILADEKRLRQVILNLLSNAVKFTATGHVTLRIRWQLVNATQGMLHFEVEDSGIGIADADLEHIFDRFIQVGDTQARLSGTGLGLAISHHLVSLMGSRISVRSQLGEGSNFCFDVITSFNDETVSISTLKVPTIVGYQGGKRRILVVDDGATSRSVLMERLGNLGFDVILAENGQAGVDMALTEHPDLIIMDLVMPLLNGQAAAKQIKASQEQGSTIPILMISAMVNKESQRVGLENGVDAFLSKPIEQNDLLLQIRNLLRLEWVYSEKDKKTSSETSILAPPDEDLKILYKFAQMGDMQQIERYTSDLANRAPLYQPFCEHVTQLARDLRSKSVLQTIKQYINKG